MIQNKVDKYSVEALKSLNSFGSPLLAHIMNLSFLNDCFQNSPKKSRVVLQIHKAGSISDKAITVLYQFSQLSVKYLEN